MTKRDFTLIRGGKIDAVRSLSPAGQGLVEDLLLAVRAVSVGGFADTPRSAGDLITGGLTRISAACPEVFEDAVVAEIMVRANAILADVGFDPVYLEEPAPEPQ